MDTLPTIPRISTQRRAAFLQRAITERVPLSGSIAMNHRCNLRCVHCYLGNERWSAPGAGGESSASFWCDIVDQIAAAGCLNLLITGGEPILRNDFSEIYTRAVQKGMITTVFTNATLIDEAIINAFIEFPPRLVEITLYGASEEVFDRVTGVSGSYRRCLAGVDALVRAGIRIGLKSMIMVENHHEISEMRKMAAERGARFRVDPALFPRRDGDASPLAHRIPPSDAVALEMEDQEYRRKASESFARMRGTPPDDRLFSCLAGRIGFHIDPAGVLLPCLMFRNEGFDLHKGDFQTGWHEVIPRFLEQKVIPGYDCNSCDKRLICGLCPAQFELETGSVHQKAEYTCQLGAERCRALTEKVDPYAKEH